MSELTPVQRKKIHGFAATIATLGTIGVVWMLSSSPQQPLSMSSLALGSMGCVATTQSGEPLTKIVEQGGKVIPKGSVLTAQCFKPQG